MFKRWSEEECATLRRLFLEEGLSDGEIARTLGRPLPGTTKKRQELGLFRLESLIDQLIKLDKLTFSVIIDAVHAARDKKERELEYASNGGLAPEAELCPPLTISLGSDDFA